jgi:hypothetical protein
VTSLQTAGQEIPLGSLGTFRGTREEILDALTSAGMDWVITSEGDLLVKVWRIAAEGFIPREQLGIIRQRSSPSCAQETEIEWVSKNLGILKDRYAGQWIAVCENAVVASAENLPTLMIRARDFDNPLITQIPEEAVIWNLAYGLKNF